MTSQARRARSLFLPRTSFNLQPDPCEAVEAANPQSLRHRISVASLRSWTKRKARGVSAISEPSQEAPRQAQLIPPPIVNDNEGPVELDGYEILQKEQLEPVELPAEVPDDDLPLSVLREMVRRQGEETKQISSCNTTQNDNSNDGNPYKATHTLPVPQTPQTIDEQRIPQRYRRNSATALQSWNFLEQQEAVEPISFQELTLKSTHDRRACSVSGAASCRSAPAVLSESSRKQRSPTYGYLQSDNFCRACGRPLNTILERDSEDEAQQTNPLPKAPIQNSSRREMCMRRAPLHDRDLAAESPAPQHRPRSSSTSSFSSASVAGSSQRGSRSSWCGPEHHSRASLSTQLTTPSWRTRSSGASWACVCRGEVCCEACPRCRPPHAMHSARNAGCGGGAGARRPASPPACEPGPSPGQIVPRFIGPQTEGRRWVPLLAQREEWLSWMRMGQRRGMNYGIAGDSFAARRLPREPT